MKWNPDNDGVDHINVYSRGKTELGRNLSNFAYTPFEHPKDGKFNTVEGWWYWTMTGEDALREMPGYVCKEVGKTLLAKRAHPTEDELKVAYKAKLEAHPEIAEALKANKLPLAHYYVYGGKVVEPKEWQWTAKLWLTVAQ